MKRIIAVLGAFFLSVALSCPAQAQFEKEKEGWFFGIGPQFLAETHVLKTFGGGPATQAGYRFNEFLSVYLGMDGAFTRKAQVNYWVFDLWPTVKANVIGGAFVTADFGYSLYRASGGFQFRNTFVRNAATYSGYSVGGGVGYDFWLDDEFTISPQITLNYSRAASSSLVIPNAQVQFSWYF